MLPTQWMPVWLCHCLQKPVLQKVCSWFIVVWFSDSKRKRNSPSTPLARADSI
jgi:hypothetical protein